MTWGMLSAQAMPGRRMPALRPASVVVVALFLALAALLTPGGSTPRAGSSLGAGVSGGFSTPAAARAQVRYATRPDGHAGFRGGGPVSTAGPSSAGNAEPGVVAMVRDDLASVIVRAGSVAGPGSVSQAVVADQEPAVAPQGIPVADRSAPMPHAFVAGTHGARAPPGRV